MRFIKKDIVFNIPVGTSISVTGKWRAINNTYVRTLIITEVSPYLIKGAFYDPSEDDKINTMSISIEDVINKKVTISALVPVDDSELDEDEGGRLF